MRVSTGLALASSAALLMSACNSSTAAEPSDERVDQAYDNATDELSGENFEDVGDTSQCTQDCGGHDAGFNWAKDHDIADVSDCGGDSQSFIEGCQEYVNARDDAADDDLDADNDSSEGQ